MNQSLLAFFSGFPDRRFPENIAKRLDSELTKRESLVFVSACPDDYARNDDDSAGMYGMFEEFGIFFACRRVIDDRTEPSEARELIRSASCVFLMGGHTERQMKLMRDKGIDAEIRAASAAVLGVSAGSINMAVRSLDTKESPVPYDGLGLADVTIKPHFSPDNREVLSELLQISARLPICATEDESAIFASDGKISFTGRIHWISNGRITPLAPENLPAELIR